MIRGEAFRITILLAAIGALAALVFGEIESAGRHSAWTASELALLRSLSIDSLPPVPPEPSNALADDRRAAKLGQQLFFDPRLSGNGQVACATCHQPGRRFTDGLPKARAIGTARRNTPSIVGQAYSPWLYWDGRKDSLWSQALAPLEDPAEHGGNRMAYVRFIATDPEYRASYEQVFGRLPDLHDERRFPPAAGPLPDPALRASWLAMNPRDRRTVNEVFANIGKAIGAYERRLLPGPSRFDAYVQAVVDGDQARQREALAPAEVAGLRLFIGRAQCIQCHNGPLLTNNEFHNTGIISYPGDLPDRGRYDGLRQVDEDPFNCLGPYSDATTDDCSELRFARRGPELIGAVRTPSLRNLQGTAPYMHKGQLPTLADVIEHYVTAPEAMIGHNEAKPLGLSRTERDQLEAFLRTLSAPVAMPAVGESAP
ncbi:MAG: cytochrome-c peroxidase [Gammaproteobacteria bacterium]|nr:cytochrome-c peroxidase [Gammaproteobacteria bacterium]MBK79884.1 cytochrome-c peroxidase [Gammaproteobacteria bacterium]|tara:strand:+ start:19083 stop:20366 length:1284 start_codon:yes stop_codon:yes gene_type:complete